MPHSGIVKGRSWGYILDNKQVVFLRIISAGSVAAAGVIFLMLFMFRDSAVSLGQLLLRAGLPGLGFIALSIFLLGRHVGAFDARRFTSPGEEYVEALKNLGEIPIKMIGFGVLLELVFLALIFFQGDALGIPRAIRLPLFMGAFSAAILASTFVYVLSDSLVCKTLISHNLDRYPRDLRENRQGLKILIVPLAVAFISIFFIFSVTLLTLYRGGFSLEEIQPQVWRFAVILMTFFFFFVAALASVLKKNSGLLYDSVIQQLENLSSEKKDLTRRISICSVDEVGTIAGMVNSFCGTVGSGMSEIKGAQHKLAASSLELERNAREMDASTSQVSRGVEQIREKARNQLQSASASASVVNQIAQNIESLDSSISTQFSSVSQASAAVEEMVGNINSIGQVMEKMLKHFKTVQTAASEGEIIQRDSKGKVHEIVEESKALQEANKIIATIAAQTNLLAMNAAIEAAHAGDAGRGFSVVADEIRKLAENSSRESQKISTELKQITGTINSIVKGSNASEEAFSHVATRLKETETLVSEVDNAIREQQDGASQILDALKVMKDITVQVKSGSESMSQGSETMRREMGRLQANSQEISGNLDEIVKTIVRISEGAGQVSSLAENTQATIEGITGIVNGFTV
jgi:methyl-accepting chemotaxis protein